MPSLLEEIKTYVDFTDEDARLLAELLPEVVGELDRVSEHFYERILAHPGAHAAITGGEAQVARLKRTFVEWMHSGLEGPHDEAFYARRARIGRVHVEIDLPQRYMVTAMDVVRLDLRELVERIHAGDADRRRRTSAAIDKLFDLELTIMLETYREDSDAKLRRRERLATLGQVAGGIGHDLRNPLGVIESSLYLLRKRTDDEGSNRHLDKIAAQVAASNRIITDLLELTRARPAERRPVDLPALLAEAVDGAELPEAVSVTTEVAPGLTLLGDPGLLRQALVNLLANAAAAGGVRGRLRLWAGAGQGGQVVLAVDDEGPGFPEQMLAEAFEPLVTGRSSGTGLGLALVRTIAERHGGTAGAENRPEGGARVSLSLPAGAAGPI